MPKRFLIVSNRLPYSADIQADSSVRLKQSDGGLVSGLRSLFEGGDSLWVGCADTEGLDPDQATAMQTALKANRCLPLLLDSREAKGFYDGFSNSTIWPLFHQFLHFSEFSYGTWGDYVSANESFAEAVLSVMDDGDVVWVHDYHLMLVPKMIRSRKPDAAIGFFLHIPFPTFEVFRMLPWRDSVLQGMLGADLIGFHTYDYAQYFLNSCHHILGLENRYGKVFSDDRVVQVDAWPLGIDYKAFQSTAQEEKVQQSARRYREQKVQDGKIMLSIERLDYSKGIPESLAAFDAFLETHPHLRGKMVFILLAIPTRENVESYQSLKRQVDEAVGAINGKYSTASWTPVEYYYRSVGFEELCSIYAASDIMLATPLRDGMNLVCKEYLAAHDEGEGVLILSEMAGSAYELTDALVINPFSQEEYIEAFDRALAMPNKEQRRRNRTMQCRLRDYTSRRWAMDFLESLDEICNEQSDLKARRLGDTVAVSINEDYHCSERRALFLDYDGTLVSFKDDPSEAMPDNGLLRLLSDLCRDPKNDVILISGRDYQTLDSWFGGLPINLVAEHGMWLYDRSLGSWALSAPQNNEWKKSIKATLQGFVSRTPCSFVEEKDFSLVWHCRACGDGLAQRRMEEIKARLWKEAESKGLTLLEGNRVIEVKPRNVSKGIAAHTWLRKAGYDFLLAAGDDTTDEDLFEAMPEDAWTIKVGLDWTKARFYLAGHEQLRHLLKAFLR